MNFPVLVTRDTTLVLNYYRSLYLHTFSVLIFVLNNLYKLTFELLNVFLAETPSLLKYSSIFVPKLMSIITRALRECIPLPRQVIIIEKNPDFCIQII